MRHPTTSEPARRLAQRRLLSLIAAAGLGTDAAVHLHLAARYALLRDPGGLSQGTLFRIESWVAIGAAVAMLAVPGRLTHLAAAVVAGSALGALVLYRYVDVGTLGPLPDMYDPFWDGTKTLTAVGEAVALLAATAGAALSLRAPAPLRRHGMSSP